MTRDEFELWKRCQLGDETARKELILLYLPLAAFWAKQLSRIATWADLTDLNQNGVIGLMKAVDRFDPTRRVSFESFARDFIRGAILDSPEFTRDIARHQKDFYITIKRAEEAFTKELGRIPTIEEIAEKTGLTIQQILNAIDAMGLASAGQFPEDASIFTGIEMARPERTIMLTEALSRLSAREQAIIRLHYWEGVSTKEISNGLGLTVANVTKIRQRAITKLAKLLEGKADEYRRFGR